MKQSKLFITFFLLYTANISSLIGPFFHPRKHNFDVSILTKTGDYNLPPTIISGENNTNFTFEAPLTNKTTIKKALNATLDSSGDYIIRHNNGLTIKNTIPAKPKKSDPFTFLVYGDLREPSSEPLAPQKHYQTKNSVAHATINYIERYLNTHKNIHPALHLLSGDITRVGGDGSQLESILISAQRLLTNQVVMSSIGNHELFNYYTRNKKNKYYLTPHFGNMFYYDQPYTRPRWFKTANKATQRYFDIGCVRFVHLPYIDFETVNGNPELVNDFIATIKQAHQDKAHEKITFIIVYTHNPLVTHPQYKTKHYGIFEGHSSHREDKTTIIGEVKKLEACFATYAVDALFCGHNHIYSRLTWGNENFSMPQITMGLGTHLHENKSLVERSHTKNHHGYTITGHTYYDKNSFTDDDNKRNILGFLSCKVDPTTPSILITLHGSPHYPDRKKSAYQKLDSFTITPRIAQNNIEMPPVCHAPFEGLGPFFHPKTPSGFCDISLIVPTSQSSTNFFCNDNIHSFKSMLNKDYELIKFLNIDLSSGNYLISQDKKLLCLGSLAYPKKDDPFSFYVYGDTRGTSTDGDTVYEKTIEYIEHYESQFPRKAVMHLNTGDLVKHGGRSNQWIDFFNKGNKLYHGRILAAALGNHELYVRPNEYYTQMIPHFANIFFLEQALKPSIPKKYLNQTVTSSDVGSVRFIHLPYIEPSFIEGMNPDPTDIFIEKLKEAHALIKNKNSPIKYIIWYIHRPFVGTQTKYKPLFTDTRDGYPQLAQKLYDALDNYPPSGIFFGHKHYYFRADYINKNNITIPMITIGFSTSINPSGKAKKYMVKDHLVTPQKVIAKQQYPNNLIGFIDCTVSAQNISGKLIGQSYSQEGLPMTYNELDSFMLFPPITTT